MTRHSSSRQQPNNTCQPIIKNSISIMIIMITIKNDKSRHCQLCILASSNSSNGHNNDSSMIKMLVPSALLRGLVKAVMPRLRSCPHELACRHEGASTILTKLDGGGLAAQRLHTNYAHAHITHTNSGTGRHMGTGTKHAIQL